MKNKLKTRKTFRKRIKITSKGKLMRKRIQTSHLKVKLDSSSGSKKGKSVEVNSSHTKSLKAMLPKV